MLLEYLEENYSLQHISCYFVIYQVPDILLLTRKIKADIIVGNKFGKKLKKEIFQNILQLLNEECTRRGLMIHVDDTDLVGISSLYEITSFATKHTSEKFVLGIGIRQSKNNLVSDFVEILDKIECM